MKLSKRLLSVALCLIMALGSVAVGGEDFAKVLNAFSVKASAGRADCYFKVGDYWCDIYYNSETGKYEDDKIEIEGLTTKNKTSISIPSVLDGRPVVSIGGLGSSEYCSSIKSISIPSSVINIHSGAFDDTAFYKNSSNWINDVLYIGTCLIEAKDTVSGSFTVKNGTTVIAGCAFMNCTKITSISIPASVKGIGSHCLQGCTALSSISVNSGNTTYKSSGNCLIKTSSKLLIAGCKNSVIPNDGSVIIIGDQAFDDCTGLTKITIPSSVTTIEWAAFAGCSNLSNISIGSGIQKIGGIAFADTAYYNKASNWTNSALYIGNNLIEVDNETDPKTFTVRDGTTCIADMAFYNCTNVTSITIPYGVKRIGYGTFSWCSNLKTLTLPKSILTIEEESFEQCKNLLDVFYLGSETDKRNVSIGDYNDCLLDASWHYLKTLAEAGLTQKRIISASEYSETNKYTLFKPVASSGKSFCAPGIDANYIPQGLAYYEEKNWILISSYDKSKKKCSVILALDADSGEFVAQFNLLTASGKPSKPHAGGVAVSNNNLYITYGHGVAYVPLSEINIPNGYLKDIKIKGTIDFRELGKTYAAYVDFSNGVLWAGNFYSLSGWIPGIPDGWKEKAPDSNSILLGYKLSGANSEKEWNNLKSIKDLASYKVLLPSNINQIQGATVNKGILYLSRTTSSSYGSVVSYCNLKLDSSKIKLKETDFCEFRNICGAENIIVMDDYLWSIYESAALNEYGAIGWGPVLGLPKVVTDCLWKANLNDLNKGYCTNIFNCPIDIDVYDDNNNLVCRIVDNVVDEDVLQSDGALSADVYEDTKYIYTPEDQNYTFKIFGNDTGTMDYTVVDYDKNTNEIKRTNFYDVNISTSTKLTGDLNLDDTDFDIKDYKLYGTETILPSETIDNKNKQYLINVSNEGEGVTTESDYYTAGDNVRLEAVPYEGIAFLGWYENGKLVERDLVLNFVAKANRNLTAKFKNADKKTKIYAISSTTVDYRSKVTLVSSANYVRNNCFIALYDGNKQIAKGNNKSVTFNVGEMKSSKTYTVKIVDGKGNVQKDSKGKDLVANIEIKVKSGFFDKIIAFFRGLFGILPEVEINPNVKIEELPIYTLTYNANGGANAPSGQKDYGPITLSNVEPTRNDYSFIGWAYSSTATTASYQPGASFTLVDNTTLYAVWKKNYVEPTSFTLTYNGNGGFDIPESQTGSGIITLSSYIIPEKEGFLFLGWSTDSSASSAQYQPGDTFSLVKDTTLYAVWQKAYILTYNLNGGSSVFFAALHYQQKGNGNIKIIALGTPTRYGYTFLGWSTNANAITPEYYADDVFNLTEDTTIFAVWSQDSAIGKTILVTAGALNVRELPDSQSTRVGSLTEGNLSTVIDQATTNEGLWYKVDIGTAKGYILAKYVLLVENGIISVGANMRAEPNDSSARLSALPEGQEIFIIDHVYSEGKLWYKLYFNNTVGYVNSSYVVLAQDVPKGDINNDGEINLVDLTKLKAYIYGDSDGSIYLLSPFQKQLADLNNDGILDDADIDELRQILVSL